MLQMQETFFLLSGFLLSGCRIPERRLLLFVAGWNLSSALEEGCETFLRSSAFRSRRSSVGLIENPCRNWKFHLRAE